MPFYAVKHGRQTGVFTTWKECEEQVKGFKGPSFRKFNTEQEAYDFVDGGAATASVVGSRGKSQDEDIPARVAPGVKGAPGVWYAVRRGRKIGLFSTWNECQTQVSGFQGAVFKKFNNHADATAFLSAHTAPSASHSLPPAARSAPPTAHTAPSASHSLPPDARSALPTAGAPVVVYTDGGCFGNGKKGARAGFGVWWGGGHPWNESGRLKGQQTNNRAEIEAAIKAVERAAREGIGHVEIRTDSEFLINCMTKWVHKWRRNEWTLADGGKVKVREHVERFDRVLDETGVAVTWKHVKGHAGERGNEEADRLAREGSMMPYVYKRKLENPLDSSDDDDYTVIY